MRTLWNWVRATKWSVLAFVLTLALGLLSMGFLGIALYYPVAPVLRLHFPHPDDWHGDWVWPAIIGVGMFWSFGFLVAGAVNSLLASRGLRAGIRRLIYAGVLWTWALLVWFVTLANAPMQP